MRRCHLAVAACAVALAAVAPAAPGAAAVTADLRVTIDVDGPQGERPARTARLRCPSARPVCRRLARVPVSAFDPVPPGRPCTQIYGGPQVARVRGTFRGRRVDAAFSRTDGCEIERWERLRSVLRFPLRHR